MKMTKLELRNTRDFYLFISPWVVGFLIFILGPIIASFFFSLTKYDVFSPTKWVGLENYRRLFFDDPLFIQSLKVTGIWVLIGEPLRLGLALGSAMLLNQPVRGIKLFRTTFYMPTVIAGVAAAVLWMWMLHPQFGLINIFLYKVFHVQGPAWIFSEKWALSALILMSLWGVGTSMVIFLAALQGIPVVFYEAAESDGANWWTKFWRITLPLLSPVMLFNIIIGIINSFQVFTQSFVMTQGGPNNATLFYVLYVYFNAFRYFKMGYASALTWILLIIIFAFTLLILKSSGVWVFYETEVKKR